MGSVFIIFTLVVSMDFTDLFLLNGNGQDHCSDQTSDCSNPIALKGICSSNITAVFCKKSCQLCHTCALQKMDIIFLLDASNSIGSKLFNVIKDVVKNVTRKFDIGDSGVRVGVELFNADTTTSLSLNQTNGIADLMKAISSISFPSVGGNSTNIGRSIDVLLQKGFSSSQGDRSDAHNVVVFISDGLSINLAYLRKETSILHKNPISVFAVNLANGMDFDYFSIPTDASHFIWLKSPIQLQYLADELHGRICKVKSDLGTWTSWTSWGPCVGRCGLSYQYRSRTCRKGDNYLHPCLGESLDDKVCQLPACARFDISERFLGCFLDSKPSVFTGRVANWPLMTWDFCANFCLVTDDKYRYVGLQNGSECHCAYDISRARGINITDCNLRCSGNPSLPCGGAMKMSVLQVIRTS